MDVEDSRKRLQEITLVANNTTQQNGNPNHEDQIRFNKLCKDARRAAEEGNPKDALECYKKAAIIHTTEKITRRIAKLEAYLAEHGSDDSEEEDTGMVHVGKGFSVYKDVFNMLYPHQKDAMMWFWRLHRKQKGGILGDDMGLGKTIQVIAYLSGLFDMEQVHAVLLILPVAVIINWEREFEKWAPGIRLETFHGSNKRERLRSLAKVQRRGGVLMTSYGLVVTNWETLATKDGREFIWDYAILDEGHKIKNPSKTTKACHAVGAKHRFILTGTPVQNNLKEFWQLFDFVSQGTLLGTQKTFNMEYSGPITRAREKDATPSEKFLGNKMAESLRQLIAPYFLRRTKADVLEKSKENQGATGDDDAENRPGTSGTSQKALSFPSLTRKNDFVVWCFLTDQQIKIYEDFLNLDQVKELMMTSRSPLVELTVLKKLCDHLRLLSVRACMQLGMHTGIHQYDDEDNEALQRKSAADQIHHMSNEELLAESGKLQLLMDLLNKLSMDGHRTLVFSQSRKMLDIIEKLLKTDNFKYLRLDGTISKLDDRQKIITKFQNSRSISVFLLTTQVGGVGLTLTGADRVVIFDPSWNPATDNQAVDRVYRIGQKETVVVYRLITCGTVEEKIYRRQIFKESITAQTVGGDKAAAKNPYRYFTKGELFELFSLDNPRHSTTQVQLEQMHSAQRKTDVDLDEHVAFLYSLNIFGISDHDLMFSKEAVKDHGAEDIEEAEDYIQERVRKAQELVKAEGELTQKLMEDLEGASNSRRHAFFTDRQQLLEEAYKKGHDIDLPQQRQLWNDHGVQEEPSNVSSPEVVDLSQYEDSFVDDEHNSTQRSSVSDQPVIDTSQSFLQDVISTLSQEEIDLNMKLMQESKRYQEQSKQRTNADPDSPMEEVEVEEDPDSSLEEVDLTPDEPGADPESSMEEVEVADQSLQISVHSSDSGHDVLNDSTDAVQVKNEPTDHVEDPDSSMEEVEVADQSLQTSVHNKDDDGDEDMMNVSMKAMTLDEDGNNSANLSMEDLALADTLDICDNLDLHIPTPSRSAKKSIAPSPLSIDRTKPRRTLLISDTLGNSSTKPRELLVEESPMAITPVLSDESEPRNKRKSSEDTPSSGEKRKYSEDKDSSYDDDSAVKGYHRRNRALRITDLDETNESSVFDEESRVVIEESDVEDDEDDGQTESPGDETQRGSYLMGDKDRSLANTPDIPTPKETLQNRFDVDSEHDQSTDHEVKRRAVAGSDSEHDQTADISDYDKTGDAELDESASGELSASELDQDNDSSNSEHDKTSDSCDMNSSENHAQRQEKRRRISDESQEGEDHTEDQNMTLGTEESFEDAEERSEEEEEEEEESEEGEDIEDDEYEEEDEDSEEDDEYTQLVRDGEHHLSNGEELKAVAMFLRALKINKSDHELQKKTLALYQKHQKPKN